MSRQRLQPHPIEEQAPAWIIVQHEPAAASDRQSGLTWAQRLKRVFAIDIDKSAGLPICTAEGRRGAGAC